ncbi:flavodoxin domain-containing protein [Agromyces sp. S2-1-8]|uniref:flavodoxin family protein n=1 Tax=unclassified Agromyces TaxID=2639701 RepID=UPI001E32A4B1|nr:flavodoxin domain-containing protein [Agromyces sp. S2-1-8]MCD5348253.1 flavodoxin domain-containing protein [Agromyces sp. S2-1-8]
MRSLVLYESMFGVTRRVGEAIADGLRAFGDADAVPVSTGAGEADDADLVVIGVPTHAHSIPGPRSRAEAAEWAADPERGLALEPGATGPGVREWIKALDAPPRHWAAFATRADLPRILAGDGAVGIERRMRRLGVPPLHDGECFIVSVDNALLPGELDRARAWGGTLGRAAAEADRDRRTDAG